jgi:hypothetical protein
MLYLRAGTEEKSGIRPSASVGCVIVISRNTVYGIPALMANWTVAMVSPAPTPKPVNPRIVSSVVLTSTLRNPLALRLRFVQANSGEFGVSEEAGRYLPSHGCPVPACKIVADDAEVVERNMSKERATGAVAERPNPGSAGLQPFIYLDKSLWGGFDSSQFKANAFCIG